MKVLRTVLFACGLAALCSCARQVYPRPKLSASGAEVRRVEGEPGGGCETLGKVHARNIHGDPDLMLIALRNRAAERGGNALRLDRWAPRVYASGTALSCPGRADGVGQGQSPADAGIEAQDASALVR